MPVRDVITKDAGWKVFSLALAVIIWLTIRPFSDETNRGGNLLATWSTRSFTNLPVVVMSSASDVGEFRVEPSAVLVTVSGRPEVVAALTEREIHVTVDLTEIESARSLRKRIDVATPPGVTFIRATPSQVDVVVPPKRPPEK